MLGSVVGMGHLEEMWYPWIHYQHPAKVQGRDLFAKEIQNIQYFPCKVTH